MRNNPLPAIITGFLLTVFAMTPSGTRAVTMPAQSVAVVSTAANAA